ncbi:MAG: alpha/beta hydrolase [Myxococcota bacterium]|nr:alpha/beta hydrolase [Myxococcota bacterium]
MSLHTQSIGSGDKLALILHGILGSGRNWSSFARALSKRCPDWQFLLVDLRAHGRSPTLSPPHTVTACAGDLRTLTRQRGQAPAAVIGHSFGGKVALAYGRDFPEGLEQVWALDSQPGAQPQGMSDSDVVQVMTALRQVPLPLERREDLMPQLSAHGLSRELALWMTTNLTRNPDGPGLVWRFDLEAATALIADYFRLDLWPVLERPPHGPHWHLLQAERSERWTQDDADRIAGLPAWSPVHHHLLPDAGHWVHVDNPQGLLELLARELG